MCKACPNGIRIHCKECDSNFYKLNKLNKLKILSKNKDYREKNKKILSEKKKEYHKNNKDKRNNYIKNKLINDPLFRLKTSVVRNINSKLKRNLINSKERKTLVILGCTIEEFKSYIELQF